MRLTVSQTMTLGVAAVTLTSLLALVWFASHAMRDMTATLTEVRMKKTAELVALTLTDAIISDDLARIDSTIDAILSADYGVLRMCVFDQQDRRISRGRCSQVDETPAPGSKIAEAAVVAGGVSHGYVGVAYDPQQNYPAMDEVEQKMFLLATGALCLTIFVSYYLGMVFHFEIESIRKALDHMAEDGELRPLRKTPSAELQRITKSFNEMIEKRKEKGHGA